MRVGFEERIEQALDNIIQPEHAALFIHTLHEGHAVRLGCRRGTVGGLFAQGGLAKTFHAIQDDGLTGRDPLLQLGQFTLPPDEGARFTRRLG